MENQVTIIIRKDSLVEKLCGLYSFTLLNWNVQTKYSKNKNNVFMFGFIKNLEKILENIITAFNLFL
jgi:hypothetical protein